MRAGGLKNALRVFLFCLTTGLFSSYSAALEITVWNMPVDADVKYLGMWKENTADFEAFNPGIKVKGISRSYKPQEFVSVMASAKGPDVARIPVSAIPVMARYGFLAKLNQFSDNWIQKDYMPKIMWQAVDIDGSVYGIPYDSYFTTLMYRRSMFEKAGLTQAPKDWQELKEYAGKVRDANKGSYGIALVPDTFNFIDLFWQAGGSIQYSGKVPVINGEAAYTALEFIRQLRLEPGLTPVQAILNESDVEQLFATGKASMIVGVANRLPLMARRYGLDLSDVEIVPLPSGPAGIKAWHSGGDAFIINAGSSPEKQAAAWKYIEHSLSAPRQLWKWVRMKEMGLTPFPGDFSCATSLVNMPEFEKVRGLLSYANAEPSSYAWPMVKEDFSKKVLEKIFIDNKADIKAMLREFNDKQKRRYDE